MRRQDKTLSESSQQEVWIERIFNGSLSFFQDKMKMIWLSTINEFNSKFYKIHKNYYKAIYKPQITINKEFLIY